MVDALEAGRKRTQEALDNDPKRPRTTGSKVLHVRALPGYTTEQELVDLCKPFGNVTKVLLLQDKNQAFVEMMDSTQAADVLAGLEYSYPTIRNKRVYWQYSDRTEVEAKTAVYVTDNRVTGQTDAAPTTILLSVTEVTIPVTLEAVHQIGSPFGSILRVITFNKGADYQALLEYATSDEANAARMGLDGKDVYEGCCHIRANFSNKSTLVVKQNDNRSWDYTLGRAGAQPFGPPMPFAQPVYYGYPGFEGAMPGAVHDQYAVGAEPYPYPPQPAAGGAPYPVWTPPASQAPYVQQQVPPPYPSQAAHSQVPQGPPQPQQPHHSHAPPPSGARPHQKNY